MNFTGILGQLLGGGDVIKSLGDGLDKLVTSDEERLEKRNELLKAEREFDSLQLKLLADQNTAQTEVNKIEAANNNIFVAGWRPAIGWVGVLALFYQYLVYPLLTWLPIAKAPPPLDTGTLLTLITGMLGIAGMRSFDKLKGTDTKAVGN